jgi:hypothetical protein
MSGQSRLKTLLETATNIAVLLASLLIVSTFIWIFSGGNKNCSAPDRVTEGS